MKSIQIQTGKVDGHDELGNANLWLQVVVAWRVDLIWTDMMRLGFQVMVVIKSHRACICFSFAFGLYFFFIFYNRLVMRITKCFCSLLR
jgi:hypothetical protein